MIGYNKKKQDIERNENREHGRRPRPVRAGPQYGQRRPLRSGRRSRPKATLASRCKHHPPQGHRTRGMHCMISSGNVPGSEVRASACHGHGAQPCAPGSTPWGVVMISSRKILRYQTILPDRQGVAGPGPRATRGTSPEQKQPPTGVDRCRTWECSPNRRGTNGECGEEDGIGSTSGLQVAEAPNPSPGMPQTPRRKKIPRSPPPPIPAERDCASMWPSGIPRTLPGAPQPGTQNRVLKNPLP